MSTKAPAEMYFNARQIGSLLHAVEAWDDEDAVRAHAMIYLGYSLGCRIGELAILRREHFDGLSKGTVVIPTLKQTERITHKCTACGRSFRLAIRRAGHPFPCPDCLNVDHVTLPRGHHDKGIPCIQLPFIEKQTVGYIRNYLSKHMRPDQQWLFEGRDGDHVQPYYLWLDFKRALALAGMPDTYVPHALRHGRAMRVMRTSRGNMKLVQACLRHKSEHTTAQYTHLEDAEKYQEMLERDALESMPPRR